MDFKLMCDYLFKPYEGYTYTQIVLESLAAFSGIVSVFFSVRKNVWVYPIGIISTVLYSYLLFHWGLFGEMMINVYYTVLSIYGWHRWLYSQESFTRQLNRIDTNIFLQWVSIFCVSLIAILTLYLVLQGSFSNLTIIQCIDSITTSLFILAMYLMAQKRIEHWILWIVGNALAIYLFLVKGYAITAIQFLVFFLLACWGWLRWRKK